MTRFAQWIDTLSQEDIEFLEHELKEGHFQKHVNIKKEQLAFAHKSCPVCGAPVDANCLMLTFGANIRKKAYFCGPDCLEYFIHENLNMKLPKIE